MPTTLPKRFSLFLLFLLLAVVSGCADRHSVQSQLNEAEHCMNADPGRALSLLDSLDQELLGSRRNKARYALLKSMALDKNYIDLTTDSIIAPAVAYYSKHGTADEKMKAYFYQGVIYFNARELSKALLSMYQSMQFMSGSNDARMKGVIYMRMSDFYELMYKTPQVKEYIEKGLEQFKLAKDDIQYHIAQLQLGVYYQSIRSWDQADSMYRLVYEHRKTLPEYAAKMLLSNYARCNMYRPDTSPEKTLALYHLLFDEYNYKLNRRDVGAYAYACLQQGDTTKAQHLFQLFSDTQSTELLYWQYAFSKNKGDLSGALQFLEQLYSNSNKLYEKKMSIGEESLLIDHLSDKVEIYRQRNLIFLLTALLVIIILLGIGLSIYSMIQQRTSRELTRMQSLLLASQEAQQLLQSSIENQPNKEESIMEPSTEVLQNFISKYRDILSVIAEIYSSYYSEDSKQERNSRILGHVDKLVPNKEDQEELSNSILSHISSFSTYGKALSSLRLSKKEQRVFCYYFIGLKPQLISLILSEDIQNIYKIRSRIKKRILTLDPEFQSLLLSIF